MASIRRQGRRYEIRECRSTPRGPRQFTLASFQRVLSPEALDAAERAAQRPFDRAALMTRARALGIPVTRRRRFPEARALLAELRRGASVDPRLVELLRSTLAPLPSEPVPEHLAEAADWIGQPEAERGRALRGLLRAADRVLRSRRALRERPKERFPRFTSNAQVPAA